MHNNLKLINAVDLSRHTAIVVAVAFFHLCACVCVLFLVCTGRYPFDSRRPFVSHISHTLPLWRKKHPSASRILCAHTNAHHTITMCTCASHFPHTNAQSNVATAIKSSPCWCSGRLLQAQHTVHTTFIQQGRRCHTGKRIRYQKRIRTRRGARTPSTTQHTLRQTLPHVHPYRVVNGALALCLPIHILGMLRLVSVSCSHYRQRYTSTSNANVKNTNKPKFNVYVHRTQSAKHTWSTLILNISQEHQKTKQINTKKLTKGSTRVAQKHTVRWVHSAWLWNQCRMRCLCIFYTHARTRIE